MKFTDVLKDLLNYSASNFPAIVTAGSSLGMFVLTIFIYKYAKKAFHANTISNSRPPYIGTLRKALSDLHASLLNFCQENDKTRKSEIFKEINQNMSYVMYHFNEYEQMNIDRKFIYFLKDNIEENKIDIDFIEKYRKYASSMLQFL
jgi:hypothetical protein